MSSIMVKFCNLTLGALFIIAFLHESVNAAEKPSNNVPAIWKKDETSSSSASATGISLKKLIEKEERPSSKIEIKEYKMCADGRNNADCMASGSSTKAQHSDVHSNPPFFIRCKNFTMKPIPQKNVKGNKSWLKNFKEEDFNKSAAESVEMLKRMAENIDSMLSANHDITAIEQFSSIILPLMQVAGPLGISMYGMVNGFLPTGNPVLNAIQGLHELISNGFSRVEKELNTFMDKIEKFQLREDYNNFVILYVSMLMPHYMDTIKEKNLTKDSPAVKAFLKQCSSTDPYQALGYINLMVNENCLPHSGNQICCLPNAIYKVDEKRYPIISISKMVLYHTVQLGLMATSCIGLNEPDEVTMEHIKEKIDGVKFMTEWVTNKLNSAWPLVFQRRAIENVIDSFVQEGNIKKTDLSSISEAIKKASYDYDSKNPPVYEYQVLVTLNDDLCETVTICQHEEIEICITKFGYKNNGNIILARIQNNYNYDSDDSEDFVRDFNREMTIKKIKEFEDPTVSLQLILNKIMEMQKQTHVYFFMAGVLMRSPNTRIYGYGQCHYSFTGAQVVEPITKNYENGYEIISTAKYPYEYIGHFFYFDPWD